MSIKETLKQAIVSILVGAVIAFLTSLMQGALDFLQGTDLTPAGSVGGMAYYIAKVIRSV